MSSAYNLEFEAAKVAKIQADAMYNEGKKSYLSGNKKQARIAAALLKTFGKPQYKNLTGNNWRRNAPVTNKNRVALYKYRKNLQKTQGKLDKTNFEKKIASIKYNQTKIDELIQQEKDKITDAELARLFGSPLPLSNSNTNSSNGSNGNLSFVPYPGIGGSRRRRRTSKNRK